MTKYPRLPRLPLNPKYTIDTNISADGVITQTLSESDKQLAFWVMNTREVQVREALIKLGWTPPLENISYEIKPDQPIVIIKNA